MDFLWKFILCCTVFLLSNLGGLQCLHLQLYPSKNFTGAHQEYELNARDETACYNFPNGSVYVESARTDECVILYVKKDCTTPKSVVRMGMGRTRPVEWSRRFDEDTAEIPSYPYRARFPYSSFHVCNQAFGGGPQLDLDIYDLPQPGNSLIKKYRGVCNCRNIPASIGKYPNIYVDMHGNKVEMFSKRNCEGTSYQLGPQDDWNNRYLQDTIRFAPRSFRPVGLDNCYRLHADILMFHFRNGSDEMVKDASETTIDWLGVDSIKNTFESSEVLQTYHLATRIPEKVSFSITGPITKLQSAEVNPDFHVSAEKQFQLMTKEDMKAELEATYKWSRGHGYNNTKTTTITSYEKIFRTSIPVEVPPCSLCTITPDVERAKNVPISYDLYANIRGSDPTEKLTTAEIRQNLPSGMKYIRDHGRRTVVVRTNGIMFAELALDVVLSKQCGPTPFCTQKDYTPAIPTKQEYRISISDNQEYFQSVISL